MNTVIRISRTSVAATSGSGYWRCPNGVLRMLQAAQAPLVIRR